MATGYLVTSLTGKIKKISDVVNEHVLKKLYIQIQLQKAQPKAKTNQWICSRIVGLYSSTAQLFPNLDVRIILNDFKIKDRTSFTEKKYNVDVVILPKSYDKEKISAFTSDNKNLSVVFLDDLEDGDEDKNSTHSPDIKIYENVVLGGTFDRLHAGHKILLSEALLRCCKRLTVGVTDTCMLESKKLWELIEPCEDRIEAVRAFLEEVDTSVEYNVVPITDIYGPTKSDPDLDLIVVSTETQRGGAKVNEVRKEKNLKELDVHVVDLVPDSNYATEEENKISSSNVRMRLLGTRIRNPQPNPSLPNKPYIIGLTGGIASGKSSVGKRLESLGAGLIDCDKIAHQLYKPGTKIFDDLVRIFGREIVAENNEIDRRKLGEIVFSDQSKLQILNDLLWPAIIEECLVQCQRLHVENKKQIVVLEAAVLLRAGWHRNVHEVWTCLIPPNEAIIRLMERNGLSENEAKSRLQSQPSNSEQVSIANVVFCTFWSYDYTKGQVEKAWKLVQSSAKL